MIDSATEPSKTHYNATPQGFDLGEVHLTQETPDGLGKWGGRKWLLCVLVEIIASLYTGMGIMSIDQWLMFTGAIVGAYGGINFLQKKVL